MLERCLGKEGIPIMKNKKLLIIIFLFFLINVFWVVQNNRLPAIGDDARWLQGTYEFTEVIKSGDLGNIWQHWQDLFIKDTNSQPRTPLFTLLSVPTFLIFGPNEKAALITNLMVLAATSWVLYFLVQEIFFKNKYKQGIGLISVILLNLMPGFYGMARLYMSEILQVFFVVLITWIYFKYKGKISGRVHFTLGVLWGLGILLRLILPLYLIIPACVYLYQQYKLKMKEPLMYYLRAGSLFLIGLLPILLTWYGKNLGTYLAFTATTSTGAIAEITSLGPVLSPITWLKFWKVIALWHFGWPIILLAVVSVLLIILFKKRTFTNLLKTQSGKWDMRLIYLILTPLPALAAATLSINKTARYFLPAEIYIIILIAYFTGIVLFEYKDKIRKVIFAIPMLLIAYPFVQSVIPVFPHLPATNYMYSSGVYMAKDPSEARYAYIYSLFDANKSDLAGGNFYLIPEQVRFNDAELQWYFTQKGSKINSIGEYSPYHTLEQGKLKTDSANVIILDTNPEIGVSYLDKYIQLKKYILEQGSYFRIAGRTFPGNSDLEIYLKAD